FAPLVLAPVLATYRPPGEVRASAPATWRAVAATAAGFAALAALALAPVALREGLGTFYHRTLGFQADRGSPFSVWGLYGGLGGPRSAVATAALALAVAAGFTPPRAPVMPTSVM